jgi:hypothetical protein
MPRKEKKYHFIYKTTNLLSGKYYIGMHSTDNLEDGYMGSGKRLRYSLNKYGKENHKVEILEFFDSREALVEREKWIVSLNEIAKEECMNLVVGGQGGFISLEGAKKGGRIVGYKNGKKHALRLETDLIYRNNFLNRMKAAHQSGRVKYKSFKGKTHTDEAKEKMRNKKLGKGLGKTNSQYGTCWINNGTQEIKIKKEDLENWLENSWVKGRI